MDILDWYCDIKNDYTGPVYGVFDGLPTKIHLFNSINGKRVSEKEWSDYLYQNKLEDLLND